MDSGLLVTRSPSPRDEATHACRAPLGGASLGTRVNNWGQWEAGFVVIKRVGCPLVHVEDVIDLFA